MDPLSDVLSLLKPRSLRCGGFDVGGDFAVQFARYEGIKCYALVSGECWLSVEGTPEPVRLRTGDCFLLPRGLPFQLATDLSAAPVDGAKILLNSRNGCVNTINGGGECVILGGFFALAGDVGGCKHAGMLLSVLPPIVHIRPEADKAEIRWSLEKMRQELCGERPGSILVVQQLAYMMLVQALRLHLEEGRRGGVGWLFALANRQINSAITCMHEDPAHRWTLQELGERVGMSRSLFALRFKELVGISPMEYLTRWRMMLAGDRLRNGEDAVSTIALSLGYESESAFSKAFKKKMGDSPRHYSRWLQHTSA